MGRLSYWGFAAGWRIGELEAALRILKREESFWTGRDDNQAKESLQRSYGNQAVILKDWGRLEEAMALHKKEEALCRDVGNDFGLQFSYGNQAVILRRLGRKEEAMVLLGKQEALCLLLGNKHGLQDSYGNQAVTLQELGRLEEAMALHKKQEVLCLQLNNKDGLQRGYYNQAAILMHWGRLEEAVERLKRQEAFCIELGRRRSLGNCYWYWGLLARSQGDPATERAKLRAALDIFTELKNAPRARQGIRRACEDRSLRVAARLRRGLGYQLDQPVHDLIQDLISHRPDPLSQSFD